MNEYASYASLRADAPEGLTREEQDELEKAHGQFILDVLAARTSARLEHPLVQLLLQPHQPEAEDDKE